MAYTDPLQVANGALLRLGAQPIASLTEISDRSTLANQWLVNTRQETLRAHPWNFGIHRTQLNTFPAGTLTPGAVTGAGVTFTASSPVFVAGDVSARLIAEAGAARIVSFVSTTQVVADIETDFANTNPIASGLWRIAPAFGWHFRYAKPTDYLRVVEVEEIGPGSGVGFSWKWQWWTGTRGNQPEPVKVEGDFLVSDAGGKLNIQFIRDVSDLARWDVMATNAWEALLAFRICYGVTGSLNASKSQWNDYQAAVSYARTTDGQEGSGDEYPSDILLAVRHN